MEEISMKIAISATGGNLDTMVDGRFGRAAWFLIVDSTSGELIEAIDNSTGKEAAHGAGIAAAARVADKGVEALLTGRVGPKAQPVLDKANVRVVDGVAGAVRDAIASFNGAAQSTSQENTRPSATPALGQGRCGQGQGQGRGMGQGKGKGQGRGQCRR
jgi:predicted Fe-Mo cluster-binding NifX family protein